MKKRTSKLWAPLAVVIVAVVAIVGAVAIVATWATGQVWIHALSIFLIAITVLLLFATGPKAYTATARIPPEDSPGTDLPPLDYRPGDRIKDKDLERLRNDPNVRAQRGLLFRSLYVGMDGRWSTSKVQALLWTFALLYALLTLFIADQLNVPSDSFVFGDLEFHEQYLLLLGGPYAAAVVAKAITTTKVADGTTPKPPSDEAGEQGISKGIRELISDDDEHTDLADFQYLMFNLLALVVFLIMFTRDLTKGLPELPLFVVALTSTAALAYLGKKAVEKNSPTITAVLPGRVRRGEKLRIEGQHLLVGRDGKPTVEIDGIEVPPAEVTVEHPNRVAGDVTELRVTVPMDTTVGTGRTVRVRPTGSTVATSATIEIMSTQISAVEPGPLPWTAGAAVAITGTGFGAARGTVSIGTTALVLVDWTDVLIRATLPVPLNDLSPTPSTLTVTIAPLDGTQPSVESNFPVTVQSAALSPTSVNPPSITLREGGLIVITGTDFGPAAGEASDVTVTLGTITLTTVSRDRLAVVASLPTSLSSEHLQIADTTVALTLTRPDFDAGVLLVSVTRPALTIAGTVPAEISVHPTASFVVTGTGFGDTGELQVALGSLTLSVVERSETLVRVALPPDAQIATDTTEVLMIRRPGWKEAVRSIALRASTGG